MANGNANSTPARRAAPCPYLVLLMWAAELKVHFIKLNSKHTSKNMFNILKNNIKFAEHAPNSHPTQTDAFMFLLSFFLSCLWPLPQQKANHDDFYLYTHIMYIFKIVDKLSG